MKETLLFLCLTLSLMAQGIKIFVNNKPFPGKTAGAPADLYLECAPTLKLLGSPTQWEAGATEIVLEGKSLAVVDQAGVPMIRAKDLCTLYGGRYDFNKGMNTVDIYAYDPIAKAKEALARIIKQRTIESEADFAVITLVCRQYLTQTLGLKLTDDVELRLVDKAEMTKLSGRQLDTYVTYTKGKGSGTGRYLFHVLQGQSPSETIHSLGWAWGGVAVGTGVAPGPPHRSVRALLTHTAPTSGLPYCALGNRGERVGLEVATLIAVASSAPKSHTLSGFAFGVCCARLR